MKSSVSCFIILTATSAMFHESVAELRTEGPGKVGVVCLLKGSY